MKNYILWIIALLTMGCNNQITQNSNKETLEKEWKNPVLPCDIPPIVNKIYEENGNGETFGKEGLILFCNRMNDKFANSGLPVREAFHIYQIIEESGLNLDESFEQPDPRIIKEKSDLTKRISIRKLSDSTYEIYYIKTGCGKTYFHGKFILPESDLTLHIEPIEVWRASFPC